GASPTQECELLQNTAGTAPLSSASAERDQDRHLMAEDAPSRRIGRLLALLFTCLACLIEAALAQPGSGEPEVIRDLRGEFSVSYALVLMGGDAAPNLGPLTRADLSFSVGRREVNLRVDPFGIRRQGLNLEVREGTELLSITHERTPSDGANPNIGASSSFQALVVATPANAP